MMSNNSMDVRAKQRLCLLACSLNSELRVFGFAPRHLSRSTASLETDVQCLKGNSCENIESSNADKFMPTCFVVANKLDIAQMQNLDDVYRYLEKNDQMVGGSNLEEIVYLSEVVLGEKIRPTLFKETSDSAQFYLFDSDLWQRLAALEHEQLLDLSIPWSETEYWRNRNHNAMDLAGFLLELAALCKRAFEEKNSLYVVVESK